MCVMEQMEVDNYAQRIEQLEDDELELKATTAEFYVELLALYLYRSELIEAKNLIQRIPSNLKTDNSEIDKLEILLNALITKNSAEFFKSVKHEWSDTIKDVMQHLKTKTMEDVFKLVAMAYTSILEENLLQMTQLTPEELKSSCQSLGWTYEEANQSTIILPVQSVVSSSAFANSKHQMFKLTEFVTFLEN